MYEEYSDEGTTVPVVALPVLVPLRVLDLDAPDTAVEPDDDERLELCRLRSDNPTPSPIARATATMNATRIPSGNGLRNHGLLLPVLAVVPELPPPPACLNSLPLPYIPPPSAAASPPLPLPTPTAGGSDVPAVTAASPEIPAYFSPRGPVKESPSPPSLLYAPLGLAFNNSTS